jgi:hypothetical protein
MNTYVFRVNGKDISIEARNFGEARYLLNQRLQSPS